MKRALALLLALLLLFSAAGAEELNSGVWEDLQDKMYRQLVGGSGLRGTFQLTVEGESGFAELLRPLSGAELQLYAQWMMDYYEQLPDNKPYVRAYFTKGEAKQLATTTLWGDGEALYLSSDMLADTVLRFPWLGDVYSTLTGAENGNPSLLPAVVSMMLHGRDWEQLDSPLRLEVETFLTAFSGLPTRSAMDGETVLTIRYVIPAQAVKTEMKSLLRVALEDQRLSNRIRNFYLTGLQEGTAFSGLQLVYEDQVIDSIPLEGDVVVTLTTNTWGELRRASATLPLTDNPWGWTELDLLSEDGTDTYSFAGAQPLVITVREINGGVTGTADLTREDGSPLRLSWGWNAATTRTTEDNVEHEIVTWAFRILPEDLQTPLLEGIDLSGYFHLYSKVDKQGGTSLETEVTGRLLGADIRLVGKLYTRERQEIRTPDTAGAQDALALSEERRTELTNDYWINLLLTLGAVKLPKAQEEEAEAEPEEDTEPEAEAEPEETPAEQEPTEDGEALGTLEEMEPEEKTPAAEPEKPTGEEPAPGSSMEPAEEIIEEVDLDEEGT